MADWFKFHNDGLDSGGLQYCISEQPLVVSVWILILTEASKNRCGKFPWDDKDFRLLGLSRKINISPGIFNQCIGLLERCGYITKKDGCIEVPGWEKIQSEYARGLERGYYKKTSETLASNSVVSSARGEERRGDKKRVRTRVPFQKPTMPEMELYASKIGLPVLEINKFYDFYESNGWRVGRNPMKSWQAAMRNWKSNLGTYDHPKGNGQSQFWQLTKELEMVEGELKKITGRASQTATGIIIESNDKASYDRLRNRRSEIKTKLQLK